MKLLVIITLLVGFTRSLIVKDNVVFYKTNDVSTTRAKWLVTFVLDLYPYSQFTELYKKVQVGKDQEKAQSEKDSHSKNRGGKKTKLTIRYLYHETYRKPNEQLFSQ